MASKDFNFFGKGTQSVQISLGHFFASLIGQAQGWTNLVWLTYLKELIEQCPALSKEVRDELLLDINECINIPNLQLRSFQQNPNKYHRLLYNEKTLENDYFKISEENKDGAIRLEIKPDGWYIITHISQIKKAIEKHCEENSIIL